jgi:AcrR family transcriptional regulator
VFQCRLPNNDVVRRLRRKQLLDAATRIFAQKGYWSASITDIIRSASVARGTFFRSKRDVFLATAVARQKFVPNSPSMMRII